MSETPPVARTPLPSPDDIRTMLEGRELDSLVAEWALGWRWVLTPAGQYRYLAAPPFADAQVLALDLALSASSCFGPPPRFSRSWEAAGQLVEGMVAAGWSFGAAADGEDGAAVAFSRKTETGWQRGFGDGPTLPLAACRAALDAARERQEKEAGA